MSRTVRSVAALLCLSLLVFPACRKDLTSEKESDGAQATEAEVSQPFDYLSADLSAYTPLAPAVYTDMTFTLSHASLCRYCTEGEDGELLHDESGEAEALRNALEDAVLAILTEAYGEGEVPDDDYRYNLAALSNYFESMRVYENTLLSLWGTPEDMTSDLGSYVAKTFSLADAEAGNAYLRENAIAISRANLVLALVYRAACLSVTEESLATLAEALTREAEEDTLTLGEETASPEPLTSSHPTVRNQAMYEAVMDYLLREGNYTILWQEDKATE